MSREFVINQAVCIYCGQPMCDHQQIIDNVFCPTGSGGGVDPSCGNNGPTGFEVYQVPSFPGKWLSPFNENKQGYGDTIHDTKSEAIEQSGHHKKRSDNLKSWEAEAAEKQVAADKKKTVFKESGMTPIQAAKQAKIDAHLDEAVSRHGLVTTRRDIIHGELALGRRPNKETIDGKSQFVMAAMDGSDVYRKVTKTEHDYALSKVQNND